MGQEQNSITELDFKRIGSWPISYRILAITLLALVGFAISFMLFLQDQVVQLNNDQQRKDQLVLDFKDNFEKAAHLEQYIKQMSEIEKMLKNLVKKLPLKGELPLLLEDISQQALAANLIFELIKPETPIEKGFYVEQPIKLILIGNYHWFGKFAAGIAKLPRIITLNDFTIKLNNQQQGQRGDNVELKIETDAKTYWYVDKEKL